MRGRGLPRRCQPRRTPPATRRHFDLSAGPSGPPLGLDARDRWCRRWRCRNSCRRRPLHDASGRVGRRPGVARGGGGISRAPGAPPRAGGAGGGGWEAHLPPSPSCPRATRASPREMHSWPPARGSLGLQSSRAPSGSRGPGKRRGLPPCAHTLTRLFQGGWGVWRVLAVGVGEFRSRSIPEPRVRVRTERRGVAGRARGPRGSGPGVLGARASGAPARGITGGAQARRELVPVTQPVPGAPGPDSRHGGVTQTNQSGASSRGAFAVVDSAGGGLALS